MKKIRFIIFTQLMLFASGLSHLEGCDKTIQEMNIAITNLSIYHVFIDVRSRHSSRRQAGRKGALQKKKQGKAFRLSIIGDYQ